MEGIWTDISIRIKILVSFAQLKDTEINLNFKQRHYLRMK